MPAPVASMPPPRFQEPCLDPFRQDHHQTTVLGFTPNDSPANPKPLPVPMEAFSDPPPSNHFFASSKSFTSPYGLGTAPVTFSQKGTDKPLYRAPADPISPSPAPAILPSTPSTPTPTIISNHPSVSASVSECGTPSLSSAASVAAGSDAFSTHSQSDGEPEAVSDCEMSIGDEDWDPYGADPEQANRLYRPAATAAQPARSCLKRSSIGPLLSIYDVKPDLDQSLMFRPPRLVQFWEWVDVEYTHSPADYDRTPITPDPMSKEEAREVVEMRLEMRRVTHELCRQRDARERIDNCTKTCAALPTMDEMYSDSPLAALSQAVL
ncbi:hypothetical protein HDU96_003037 [Phlyctochytrium bullatum]|nr:hypothetical protein HDU96_003037 [Phlyctochytrium bullatum]